LKGNGKASLVSRRLEGDVVERPVEEVSDGEARVEDRDLFDFARSGDDDTGREHGYGGRRRVSTKESS
jgi:hypothetical protein